MKPAGNSEIRDRAARHSPISSHSIGAILLSASADFYLLARHRVIAIARPIVRHLVGVRILLGGLAFARDDTGVPRLREL